MNPKELITDESPKRHWTEYLDNDEATDRDDWEWGRQDDFGDPWDREDPDSYYLRSAVHLKHDD